MNSALISIAEAARQASYILAIADSNAKNTALLAIADALVANEAQIIAANRIDLASAEQNKMPTAMQDRLALDPARIFAMADGVRHVATLPDPIGQIMSQDRRPNGLFIQKRRVPLGVIGIIYESRPNVTVDAVALCLKSGNCAILRGGSEAINTNIAIMEVMRGAVAASGFPSDVVALVSDTSREVATQLMQLNGYVDVLIPRGGAGLIQSVVKNATVPVIETGTGNCHIYVCDDADFSMAQDILINAKTSRPSVCNAAEKLLVDANCATGFLPSIVAKLRQNGVEVRGCERVLEICKDVSPAAKGDWGREYNDYIIAIKVVDGIDAAISHINRYGTRHSEAIITTSSAKAERFLAQIDAAAVYHNASTRFTDGFEFGFGAEIGISTQKLHARGPMGLCELTSIKYAIYGSGQTRRN